jgi:hypothetical protein
VTLRGEDRTHGARHGFGVAALVPGLIFAQRNAGLPEYALLTGSFGQKGYEGYVRRSRGAQSKPFRAVAGSLRASQRARKTLDRDGKQPT